MKRRGINEWRGLDDRGLFLFFWLAGFLTRRTAIYYVLIPLGSLNVMIGTYLYTPDQYTKW